jgi:hypothetical protein
MAMVICGLIVWPPGAAVADSGKLTLKLETFSDASFTTPKTDFKQDDQIFVQVSLENYEQVSAAGIEQIGFRVYYSNLLGSTAARTVGPIATQMNFSSADLSSDADYPGLRAASFELYDQYKTVEDALGNETQVGDPIMQNGVLASFRINVNQVAPTAGDYPLTIAKVSLTTFNGDTANPAVSVKNPVTDFIDFQETSISILADIVTPLGEISGQVHDPSGLGLSGVTVAALQAGSTKGTTTTGADGSYRLSLAPGQYDVKFTGAAAYRVDTLTAVEVLADQTATLNHQLTPKTTITVTADSQSIVYGSQDAQLSYQYTGWLDEGDAFTGSLTRAAGTDVGTYAILQGSLGLDADKYILAFIPADYQITAKPLTLSGLTVQDKVYDGSTAATYSGGTLNGVVSGDDVSFTGAVSFVDKSAGAAKPVTANFRLTGADAGNYLLTQPVGLTGNITRRALTVSAQNQSKYQGSPDPSLTYNVATLASGDSKESVFSGALDRQPGEHLGQYDILQGTLALTVDGAKNYTFTFVPGKLTIKSVPVYQPDPTPVNPPQPDPTVEDGATTLSVSGTVETDESGQAVAESYTADDSIAEQVQRAKELGASTVQLELGLNAPPTRLIKATVPVSVFSAASEGAPASVVLQTAAGGITLPPALVADLAEQNQPLIFTAQRLAPEMVQAQLPNNTEAVADPLQIETTLRGRTLVNLPVHIALPVAADERQALLASYSVFAQHSNGSDESIADLTFDIDDSLSPPVLRDISFSVDQFSIFTVVRTLPQSPVPELTTRVGWGSYQFNGETYAMEPCYYQGNDTMMTLRMLEPFGVKFGWDAASQTVTMTYGEKTVKLRFGSNLAEVNGLPTPIVAASGQLMTPAARNGRTSVPLRFVSEQLGFQVHWAAHVITIKP